MRQASDATISLLNSSRQFSMADLYTITLTTGSIVRYSGAATAIVVNGLNFPLGPRFERSRTKVTTGIQVDELVVKVYPDETDRIGSQTFLRALWTGQLDGALLQLERAFMPTYGDTSPGTVILFSGRISTIDCTRTGATINVKSHLELLNIQMPRSLWQSTCPHTFGDAMCQFNRSSLALNFAATSGSTMTSINGAPVTTVPYKLGTIVGLTGENAGYSRSISGFVSGGAASVKLAFIFPVSIGDEFSIMPGCDKTQATCANVYNNVAHFGGFPYIPSPESAV